MKNIKILQDLPTLTPNFNFVTKPGQAFTNCKIDDESYDRVNDWLKSKSLLLGHFSSLVYLPGGSSPLHVDYRNKTEFPKVNWIFGGGTMRVFKSSSNLKPTQHMKTDLNLPYEYYDSYEGMEEIESFTGSGTLIINAATPHDVVNIRETRYCFSLTPLKRRGRFFSWEEATKMFT